MVRVASLLCVALACLGLAACGGGDEPNPAEREPTPSGEAPTLPGEFAGQDRENYNSAREICGAFPAVRSARDLGLRNNRGRTAEELVEIAEKYAEGFRPNFQQAAFEGCLDGLPESSE